jgi:hypothetical protein
MFNNEPGGPIGFDGAARPISLLASLRPVGRDSSAVSYFGGHGAL